ncbi:MAG: class SAM-dependent methyltransferase [Symbiobacteriaceae bacterium]|nr:class SAM-dependent methyltransferase [Symbiobacteriaceae bacterium]
MTELPRSTRALLELANRRPAGTALDVGSYLGAVAREVGCTYVNVDLTACTASGLSDTLHADELPTGPFAAIFFDAREYDPALAAETVASAALRLAEGGVLITTARPADVEACFAQVQAAGEALVASQPREGVEMPAWSAYEAAFGGKTYRIQSAPGVFSPRHLDEGTAFMLGEIEHRPGARFLDLGCGAGIVSRIASEAWGCQVTAVDVNARALRLTALNAPEAEVIASDGLAALGARQFDIIASNPPYHTDFGVAKAFIEGANRHLAMDGMLYLVIKRADWYVQKIRSVFGGCRIAEQNGYTLIAAQRRPAKPRAAAPAAPATTKKHAKRMAAAQKKKH